MGRNPYWSPFGSEELIEAAQRGIRDLHAAHQVLHIQRKDAVLRATRDLTR